MPKVPHTREHHRHAAFIGGVNHFLVAHRAAGLNHAGGALVHHHVQAVAEREKRVAGDSRALQTQGRMAGLDGGDAR